MITRLAHIFSIRRQENNTNLRDSFVCVWMAGRFKRGVANYAFIAEDPNAPQVHLLTVGVALDHLWREVIQCPTHGAASEKM